MNRRSGALPKEGPTCWTNDLFINRLIEFGFPPFFAGFIKELAVTT